MAAEEDTRKIIFMDSVTNEVIMEPDNFNIQNADNINDITGIVSVLIRFHKEFFVNYNTLENDRVITFNNTDGVLPLTNDNLEIANIQAE
jgi:hypothetical protein